MSTSILRRIAPIILVLVSSATVAYGAQSYFVEADMTFAAGLLVSDPVCFHGEILIDDGSGERALQGLPHASYIAHVAPVLSPARLREGPWRIGFDTADSPATVAAALAGLTEVAHADGAAPLPEGRPDFMAGEAAKAWFPLEADQQYGALCRGQLDYHFANPNELPAPTLSDVGADACSWYVEGDPSEWNESWFPNDMDLPQAWAITQGSSDVVVAILDGGLDLAHPEMSGPGPANPTLEELLTQFPNAQFVYTTNDAYGDDYENDCSGVCGDDEDNDGYTDEDPTGLFPGNTPEADVYEGAVSAYDSFAITDLTAQWTPNEHQGLDVTWRYTIEGKATVAISSAPIASNTTNTLHIQRGVGSAADTALDLLGEPGLLYTVWFDPTEDRYLIGDRRNSDPGQDQVVDDFWPYNPNDDDENGIADDIAGANVTGYTPEYFYNSAAYTNDTRPITVNQRHGTWLSGIIAARSSPDGEGLVGVAPGIKILPVRIHSASSGTILKVRLAEGIRYVRSLRNPDGSRLVDIISLSTDPKAITGSCAQFTDPGDLLGEQVLGAISDGMLIVSAAGNDDAELTSPRSLSCFSDVVVVAGVTLVDKPWVGGGAENGTSYGSWVDISAVAHETTVITYFPTGSGPDCWGLPNTGYGYNCYYKGTSLASPRVAGVAALMMSAYPQMDAQEIRRKLLASVDSINFIDHPTLDGKMGSGRVNAYKALTWYGKVPDAAADTTWSGTVWVGGDINVPAGKRLEIAPGTVVKIAQDDLLPVPNDGESGTQIEWLVEGSLDIRGDAANPVVFELFTDDPQREWGPFVVVNSGGTQVVAASHAVFSNLALDDLTAPNGTEVVPVGVPFEITWTTTFSQTGHTTPLSYVETVRIEYSADNGENYSVLAAGEANDGSFFWTPAAGDASGEGVIRIVFLSVLGVELGADVSDQSFVVTGETAYFVNRSADTQLNFDVSPYAGVAIDYNESGATGAQDLLLTDSADRAALAKHVTNTGNMDVPLLTNVSFSEFRAGEYPDALRGTSFADIDNDGDLDIFVASQGSGNAPRLYRNDYPAENPSFTDIGATIGPGPLSSIASDSWTGCWGDFDRDGLVDLLIGRGGTDVQTGEPSGALPDVLLRNLGGGQFEDITSQVGLNSGGNVTTVTASWADFNNDGGIDLFVGSAEQADSRLYINDISHTYVQTFVDSPSLLPTFPNLLVNVVAASWADLNNDSFLDLALAEFGTGNVSPRVLWNNGQGALATSQTYTGGIDASGIVVLDRDLDGALDLIASPHAAATVPLVLKNDVGTPGSFSDVTASVGLDEQGAVSFRALVAADFGGPNDIDDGDLDLFLGRPSSNGKFYYQSRSLSGGDSPSNEWLRVRLKAPDGGNNRFGVGSQITVMVPDTPPYDLVQTQIVDGGSGRGSQSALPVTFGLGQTAANALIRVRWPDGTVQDSLITNVNLGRTVVITDDHVPSILDSSVDSYYLPFPSGSVDWVFEWVTEFSTDPSLDAVYVENWVPNPRNPNCSISPTTLTPETPGVEHFVAPKQGGGYVHRLTWPDRACYVPCSWRYRVTSGVTASKMETSADKQHSVSMCLD